MHDEIYGYVDVDAQGAVDPKVREYLRFIVSREGQQCVQRARGLQHVGQFEHGIPV